MSRQVPGVLLSERSIVIQPSLIRLLGGHDVAALVQEVWFRSQPASNAARVGEDGELWAVLSTDEWCQDVVLTRHQFNRCLAAAVELGVLIRSQQSKSHDRTAWTRVDLDRLSDLLDAAEIPSSAKPDDASSPQPIVRKTGGSIVRNGGGSSSAGTDDLPSIEEQEQEQDLVTEVTDLFGSRELVKPDLDAEFEEWWKLYPRKVSKEAARKAWRAARKRASVEVLTDGLERFCAQPKIAWDVKHKNMTYIPHAATWLNAGKWMDEPEVAGQDPRGAATVRDWEANGSFFGGR